MSVAAYFVPHFPLTLAPLCGSGQGKQSQSKRYKSSR